MSANRKKPTKAQAKARKEKRTHQKAVQSAVVPKKPAQAVAKALPQTASPVATPKNPKATKKVLHVWSGIYQKGKIHKAFRGEQWQEVRMDPDPANKPDILGAITDLDRLEENSMDAVYSCHGLHKLYPHQIMPLLQGWRRVLKPEGILFVMVPDIQTAALYVANGKLELPLFSTPLGPVTPLDLIYGHRNFMYAGKYELAHHMGFAAETIGACLRDAGFSHVQVCKEPYDLSASGVNLPFEHPDRVEKIMLVDHSGHNKEDVPKMPTPKQFSVQEHPGFIRNGLRTDELDLPPRIWEPLGLKKK